MAIDQAGFVSAGTPDGNSSGGVSMSELALRHCTSSLPYHDSGSDLETASQLDWHGMCVIMIPGSELETPSPFQFGCDGMRCRELTGMPDFAFDKPCEFWNARTHRKFTIRPDILHLTFMPGVDLKLTAQGMNNFPPDL
jgi:hypothetical protein